MKRALLLFLLFVFITMDVDAASYHFKKYGIDEVAPAAISDGVVHVAKREAEAKVDYQPDTEPEADAAAAARAGLKEADASADAGLLYAAAQAKDDAFYGYLYGLA